MAFKYPGAFSLETDVGSFLTWLELHIRALPEFGPSWGVEVTDGVHLAVCGYYTNSEGRRLNDEEVVRVLANSGEAHYSESDFHGLGFKVIPLPPNRVAVHAGYDGEKVEDTFKQLLLDIRDAFKESQQRIDEYLKPQTEALVKPNQEPKVDPWKAIKSAREQEMVRLWWHGCDKGQIAKKFPPLQAKTVETLFSLLRKSYGKDVVPLANDPRRLEFKNRE